MIMKCLVLAAALLAAPSFAFADSQFAVCPEALATTAQQLDQTNDVDDFGRLLVQLVNLKTQCQFIAAPDVSVLGKPFFVDMGVTAIDVNEDNFTLGGRTYVDAQYYSWNDGLVVRETFYDDLDLASIDYSKLGDKPFEFEGMPDEGSDG